MHGIGRSHSLKSGKRRKGLPGDAVLQRGRTIKSILTDVTEDVPNMTQSGLALLHDLEYTERGAKFSRVESERIAERVGKLYAARRVETEGGIC